MRPRPMPAPGLGPPPGMTGEGSGASRPNQRGDSPAVGHPVREVSLRFLGGLAVFGAGFALHVHSDNILRGPRAPGRTGYSIPCGGAFRHVSCPNHLEHCWDGAVRRWRTWSWSGLAFSTCTARCPRTCGTYRLQPRWWHEKTDSRPPVRHPAFSRTAPSPGAARAACPCPAISLRRCPRTSRPGSERGAGRCPR